MDDYFTIAVHSLRKPQDKKKLVQNLIVIRKGIDDSFTSQKFNILNESGCIKNLVGCLQLENNYILDITLSILGNCCIEPNFVRNAVKLNILHYLDRVLEKHNKNSIVGRVFRIIGNVCENMCSTTIIGKEPLLISKIVMFINKISADHTDDTPQASEATVLMAVRTIRKLLKKSTLESLIVEHKVLKAVGAVMIKYVDEWEANGQNQNVIEEILRLLHIYSRYFHPNLIQSLRNTEKGDSLLCLAKLITFTPSRVTKIIVNLSRYCSLKSDLPIYDIWQRLLEKIKTDVGENSYMEYLRSMCKLVDVPSNIAYMKLDDSISQLITTLKDFSVCSDFSMECSTLILSMLNKTQYDEALVSKQISCNIVNILIDKFEWTGVSSTIIQVHNHVKKKRKGRFFEADDNKKLKLFLDCDSYNDVTNICSSSEDRCGSPSELSEVSSDGPYSPSSAINAGNMSDSDNYSPVCSDAEDTDLNSFPSLSTMDTECATPSDEDDMVNLNGRIKYKLLFEMNALLWRYSRVQPTVLELGNPKLLTTLINVALTNENWSWSQKLIMVILRKPDYLLPLMQTSFIQTIYDLTRTKHDVKDCYSCSRAGAIATIVLNSLIRVAESGVGRGDIAHTLLRSNTQVKDKIVVAIPYIITSKNLITKLLINCGGLDILLNLLEKKSEVQENSIKALCVLAIHQLKIKNPIHNQPQKKLCDLDVNSYCISESCTNVVSFKLDDGNIVLADRNFLSDKSDYFNRLLSGSFKESEQSEITLQNISTKSLKLLLILLHCKIASLGIINLDLDTLLDLLEITERYLLIELNVYLTGCVEQLHMSNKTVPLIYQWSIESGTNILRVETIAFALVGNILDSDRIHMFHDLFNLGYYKQLRDDIQKLLVRFLR